MPITNNILQHLQYLDQHNQFQAMIDYIQQLPESQKNASIYCELARAYNNLYWSDKTPTHRVYLQNAVDILLTLPNTEVEPDIWHYNLGYAYYFLEDYSQAEYHLLHVVDYCQYHVHDLLKQIQWVKKYHISAVEASVCHTYYLVQDMIQLMKSQYLELYQSLQDAVDEQALIDFEQNYQCQLPNEFKQLYRVFNGQNHKNILARYSVYDYFVALDEIPMLQQQWLQQLQQYFGQEWQSLPLSHEMVDGDIIQAQLYHQHWLPILISGQTLICMDLAPIYPEDYGQMIAIHINEHLEQCWVRYYADGLQDVLDIILADLKLCHQNHIENESPIIYS